jgi:hypothetical protein
LNPEEMSEETYAQAICIVDSCDDNQVCIEFVDGRDQHEQPARRSGGSAAGELPETGAPATRVEVPASVASAEPSPAQSEAAAPAKA